MKTKAWGFYKLPTSCGASPAERTSDSLDNCTSGLVDIQGFGGIPLDVKFAMWNMEILLLKRVAKVEYEFLWKRSSNRNPMYIVQVKM